jgi:peptidyl-tRNA hydrolase
MPPGKLASQLIHASRLSLLRYLRTLSHSEMLARMDEFIALNTCGSAITLRAKNLAQLLAARDAAEDAGLPCTLFTDSGHVLLPHFDGTGTISGLAIGPARREAIDPITRKFRCIP